MANHTATAVTGTRAQRTAVSPPWRFKTF
jgi:hypothetical protein